jgi:hypothetical protein
VHRVAQITTAFLAIIVDAIIDVCVLRFVFNQRSGECFKQGVCGGSCGVDSIPAVSYFDG